MGMIPTRTLFNLDYSRVEVATDARHRPMKFITNERRECGDPIILPERHEIATSQDSSQGRCGEIGSPFRVKMPTFDVKQPIKKVKFKILLNSSYDVDNIED